jgi:hypothetical protein
MMNRGPFHTQAISPWRFGAHKEVEVASTTELVERVAIQKAPQHYLLEPFST